MKPVSPVMSGCALPETVFAKDQPQYLPLPAIIVGDHVISHWKLSWRERLRVLFSGSIWLALMTFKRPLQPISFFTENPLSTFYLQDEFGELPTQGGVKAGKEVVQQREGQKEEKPEGLSRPSGVIVPPAPLRSHDQKA